MYNFGACLQHLVGSLSEAPLTTTGPNAASQSTFVLRALARIVPRLPSGLLLRELDGGRLMESLKMVRVPPHALSAYELFCMP